MADPGAGRNDGWRGGKPRFTAFQVARDSGRIAYPLGRFETAPEGYTVEVTELYVFDPATDQTTMVAPDIADTDPCYGELSFYAIDPSGDHVVIVGPDLTPDRCLTAITVAPVNNPDRARALGQCGRRPGTTDTRCGAEGLARPMVAWRLPARLPRGN
jgi:hypothetical protein